MKKQMKLRSMYALLIAAATLIGIAIYGSCSSDDDYFYGNELKTRADAKMTRGNEMNPNNMISCGIWCIAYLSKHEDETIESVYNWVKGKAEEINIPTAGYIKASQMVILAKKCNVNISNSISKPMGFGTSPVIADSITKEIRKVLKEKGSSLNNCILGYYTSLGGGHYVVGTGYSGNTVTYQDPTGNTTHTRADSLFDCIIY